MKLRATPILTDFILYLIISTACFLMFRSMLQYVTFDEQAGFLVFKQVYLHLTVWKTAFYIHVFTSLLTLLAGLTQFSSYILTHHKVLHRTMGRVYAYAILFVNFPAGFIMAIYANGYWPSKLAFLILDGLWFWFTLKAVIEIKRGNTKKHQQYMLRSYALTFSAITLRTWRGILSALFIIDPVTLYIIDAWLGFVPNLLLAEWIIRRKVQLSEQV